MIVLTNTAAQTVAPGAAITFNIATLKTGCSECWRTGTGSVQLRAQRGVYDVSFGANISGATAGTPIQLAMALGGEVLPETVMVSTPAAANDVNNVYKSTLIQLCCDGYDRVTIVNNGTAALTIPAYGALLKIFRKG